MSIPASDIVSVIPGVVGAGGSNALLSGLYMTQSTLLPTGSPKSFSSQAAVASYFGDDSVEALEATIYFGGFTKSTKKPATVLFAPFNLTARPAYLRSGDLSSLTLAQIQALSGSLTIVFDGYARADASLNLSTASSQSDAATKITTAINTAPATEASTDTGTIATTTLTVAGIVTGTFAPGQTLLGTSVTTNTIILSQVTSTETDGHMGGKGTYHLSQSSTVSVAEAMTTQPTPVTVTWNSTQNAFVVTSGLTGVLSTSAYATGTLAANLKLTSATGATLSQGAAADTPASAMNKVIAKSQNWCGFTTLWEPVVNDKIAFAAWSNAQPYYPYLYAGWDTDAQAVYADSTECFGYLIIPAAYNGVIAIGGDPNMADGSDKTFEELVRNAASFVLGAIASVDFDAKNGRITFMFKSQSGLGVTVDDLQLKDNLVANGYSFYGSWASKANEWEFFANSALPGDFKWLDDFIDQVWLLDQFQVADMNLLTQVGSISYNEEGFNLLRASKMDTITEALNFGAIRTGVTLSNAQIAEINAAAGKSVASAIQAQGYYLQILDPGAEARDGRKTPVQNFWYTNGGAVQKLVLNALDVM